MHRAGGLVSIAPNETLPAQPLAVSSDGVLMPERRTGEPAASRIA